MIIELRKLIATWLILALLKVLPDGEYKANYAVFLLKNNENL